MVRGVVPDGRAGLPVMLLDGLVSQIISCVNHGHGSHVSKSDFYPVLAVFLCSNC